MTSAIIAAMDRSGVIGLGQTLPWKLPADLRRFRDITMGKPLVMGRKTFASIGRPLPGRHLIILTRDPSFVPEGCKTATTLLDAVNIAEELLHPLGVSEWLVAGGGEIYSQTLPLVNRLYLTLVDGQFAGDVFFPRRLILPENWHLHKAEYYPADSKNIHSHAFVVLDRTPIPEPTPIPSPVQELLHTTLNY